MFNLYLEKLQVFVSKPFCPKEAENSVIKASNQICPNFPCFNLPEYSNIVPDVCKGILHYIQSIMMSIGLFIGYLIQHLPIFVINVPEIMFG